MDQARHSSSHSNPLVAMEMALSHMGCQHRAYLRKTLAHFQAVGRSQQAGMPLELLPRGS